MRIVADSKIPFVQEAFADVADVVVVDTQKIAPTIIRDADALLIRSETKVNESLLHGAHIKFVATATIGTDHIDTEYLQRQGIGFASAPGSNANSVAEYIVAALLALAERTGVSVAGKNLGVVGVGNVGRIVVRYARALGMNVLQNDPPRARETGDPAFVPLNELMGVDFVSLHVPLTKSGDDRTYHLFDEQRIGRMKPGSTLINTSRGGVVETAAIKNALHNRHLGGAVLDVWENEPIIDPELLLLTTFATPHIAGYSFDGKVNGTVMIHKAVCERFGLQSGWRGPEKQHQGVLGPITIPDGHLLAPALLAAINCCYDIRIDDRRMREMSKVPESERGAYFRRLRADYPVRREFFNHEVVIPQDHPSLIATLQSLGFKKITAKE